MSNVAIQVRVSRELKQESEQVFANMGMTTAEAIRIFLKQVANTGEFPFQPTAKSPNAKTLEAMAELEMGDGQVFQSTQALFADWEE
ncbi:MAG: type II toxin-antitoxin system RelB/DinJ family antitoxin [Chloroflexi bacterium]|nr:type II toxin-antitoxin system RelB/DinJ family antitoxin [Chloroflexota bacterium]